jgi:NAD(P)-dependent dehydrogenase (short-subunit alcohol dehydrogenase family)
MYPHCNPIGTQVGTRLAEVRQYSVIQSNRVLASAPGSRGRDNSWGWGAAVNLTLLNTVCLPDASRAPGRPDDVAAAVMYLASLEASFVTGELLNVNGAWLFGR